MKKNVIAVILSIVMAVGSIGTAVPVFAAEEGSTTEAVVEDKEEEVPEDVSEEDDSGENTEDAWQSDSDTVESDAGDDGNASIEDDISDNGSDQVSDDKNPASETEEESVPDTEMQDEDAAEESSDMASPAGAVASGTCGKNLTWALDGKGTLTISGTGAMDDYGKYETYSSPWFENRESVRSVAFPSGITHIGNYAFFGCSNLDELTIPANVTSLGYCMIMDTSIQNIIIPKKVSSCSIEDYLYSQSGPLGGSNVTKVEFEDGMKTIPDNICAGGHYIEQFQRAPTPETIIQEVVIPDSVTTIGTSAFSYCKNLSEVKIPSSVTKIGASAFYYCTSLSKATLEFDTDESRIGYAGLTIESGVFAGCSALSEQNMTENAVSIGLSAFSGCGSLTEVISNAKTVDANAFRYDNKLKTVVFKNVESLGATLFGFNGGNDSPNWSGNVSEIKFTGNAPSFDENTFSGCTLTAYYPKSNSTWTSKVMQNYGGQITWAPWAGTLKNNLSNAIVTLKDAFQDDEGNNCYEYTGAQIKPGILEVRLGDKTLVNGTDYTAAYGTNLSYGEGTVTLKGKGDYEGELVVKFLIVPRKITGLKGNNKLSTNEVAYTNYRRGLDLTWDKNPDKTIAYEIQYSKKSDFSDAKMAAVKAGTNTFSPKEEPLERGAEYYVRVRAYKEVNQKYYNGKWSDPIKVKAGNQILTSELWGFKNYKEKLTLTDFITVFGNEKGEAGAHYRDEYKGQYGTDPLKVKGEDASNTFMSPFRILFNNGIWTDGICGGMCNTAIVYYNHNTPDFGTYPELSSITAADLPNVKSKAFNSLTLKDSIKYAQIAQRDSRRWYFEDLLSKNRLDMLYQAVIECEMAETEPVNIGIIDGEVPHQVIAVGIKEETPTYVVIEVYDPNRVTVPSELKLYKNSIGEFYAWEFPFKDQVIMYSDISSDDDGCIYLDRTTPFVATAFSQIDQQGFASNLTFRPYLSASGSENTDLEFLQDHLNKAGINWAQELQDAETSASETTNNGTLKTVSYLVDTDTINISNVPAGVELTFAEGNQFVSVEPTTESNIYIKLYDNDNSSIKVIPQKDGTCKVTFFRGEPMPSTYTDLKRVEADVNGNQEFVINNEIDNIYFSGAKNIAINRDSGNISKDNSITNETIASLETELNLQDKYRFFQEDDIAYIKCDKDNNGEYETGITESEVETSGPKIIASGTCGENVSWKLDEDGVLTISGSGKMKDYYSNPFSLYKYEVKKVRIETGVTSIGSNAFDGCSNLTSITIPEGVTKIGSFAFGRCSSLRNLTIPESVTIINGYAFDECSSLTSITIPKSVKIIDGCAFEACSNLASVKIPEGVTSIEWRAFYNCSSLKNITIPKGVQRIDSQAFANCSNLKSVTILDPETWINDEVFLDCINLSTVTLPDVIPIIQHRAFHNTMWLKAKGDFPSVNGILLEYQGKEDNVVIPDEVTTIGIGAFYEQESLVSITIPDSVTSINDLAFYKCRGLKNIIIPDSVTSIGHLAFEDCISLKQITLPRNIKSMSVSIFDNDKELTVTVKNKYGLKYCQDNGIPFIDRSAIETKLTSFNGSDIRINITKREDASGYQIKYADNSSMTNAKSVILKGSNNLFVGV